MRPLLHFLIFVKNGVMIAKKFCAKISIMLIEFLYSKIHRATVTEANVDYVGSITIDSTLLKAANLRPNQKVDVLNVTNGERFHTYIIEGEANSGIICINGAAAHKAKVGHKVIVVAYATLNEQEAATFKPTIVHVDEGNRIISS